MEKDRLRSENIQCSSLEFFRISRKRKFLMFLEDNKCLRRWSSFDHYTLYTCQKYHHIPWICMNFMSQLKIKERRLDRKLLFSVLQVRSRRDTGQEPSLCVCFLCLIPSSPLFSVRHVSLCASFFPSNMFGADASKASYYHLVCVLNLFQDDW